MKKKINIFSNIKIDNFLKSLLLEYELNFMKLDKINYSLEGAQTNIVIINNKEDNRIIKLNKFDSNYLIISNQKNIKSNLKKNVKFINTPISINNIKTAIEIFLEDLKFSFHDIFINNEKLINLKNNLFCYITKVEFDILSHLISEQTTSKTFIKENILNIKSNIETNSLESHLTRIRKKMNKINTNIKIQSKSDKLSIIV
tara:strand:- start:159 stop:761 length:603 start_codon:yes stop_codon:yes gene_type:complete